MSFEGKVVVITGGGGGIGKAAAARFLAEGGSVVLSSRRRSVLESAQRELDPVGERSLLVAGDVSSADGARRLIDTAADRFGGVDSPTENYRGRSGGAPHERHARHALEGGRADA